MDDIDRQIGAAMHRDETRLVGMEDGVWARIAERRDQARMGQVRLAAIALALVLGVANGLMLLTPRPEPSEMRIFTVSAGLSPIASLDVRG